MHKQYRRFKWFFFRTFANVRVLERTKIEIYSFQKTKGEVVKIKKIINELK